MDPWNVGSERTVRVVQVFDNSADFLTFEDNFIDSLPDSQEYIAILESKLQKLKSNPSVIKQLQEKREACMRELLCGITNCFFEEEFSEEHLQKTAYANVFDIITPQKLSRFEKDEIVEFIRYDQFNGQNCENDKVEDMKQSLNSTNVEENK